MDNFDAGILFGVIVCDSTGVVGGAVIFENDFEISGRLGNDRVETGFEVFFGVINRNDDRNFVIHVQIIAHLDKICFLMYNIWLVKEDML